MHRDACVVLFAVTSNMRRNTICHHVAQILVSQLLRTRRHDNGSFDVELNPLADPRCLLVALGDIAVEQSVNAFGSITGGEIEWEEGVD